MSPKRSGIEGVLFGWFSGGPGPGAECVRFLRDDTVACVFQEKERRVKHNRFAQSSWDTVLQVIMTGQQ